MIRTYRSSTGMTQDEKGQVVHAAAKGVPHAFLVAVLRHLFHGVRGQVWSRRRLVVELAVLDVAVDGLVFGFGFGLGLGVGGRCRCC